MYNHNKAQQSKNRVHISWDIMYLLQSHLCYTLLLNFRKRSRPRYRLSLNRKKRRTYSSVCSSLVPKSVVSPPATSSSGTTSQEPTCSSITTAEAPDLDSSGELYHSPPPTKAIQTAPQTTPCTVIERTPCLPASSINPTKGKCDITPDMVNRGSVSTTSIKERHRTRRKKTSKVIKRKMLFRPLSGNDKMIQEFHDHVQGLVLHLGKANLLQDFMCLLRLIATGQFPLENIAFMLLLEVAKWYALPTTSQMTYSEDTKLFWRVGYKLFHGGFIRFMSGGKSEGQVIEGSSMADHLPSKSTINFAVPDIKILRDFNACSFVEEFPSELPPGIIHQSIEMKAQTAQDVSHILSLDGKKVAAGLTDSYGDEDLFGHEQPSLQKKREQLQDDLACVNSIRETLSEPKQHQSKSEKSQVLYNLIRRLSLRTQELRNLKVKQTFALKKFIKWGGPDWRKSKYLHAISSTQARLHQVRGMW